MSGHEESLIWKIGQNFLQPATLAHSLLPRYGTGQSDVQLQFWTGPSRDSRLNIYYKPCSPQTPLDQTEKSGPDYCFIKEINSRQKDIILAGMLYDGMKANLYTHTDEMLKSFEKHIPNFSGVLKDDFVIPKIITTKQVLFPRPLMMDNNDIDKQEGLLFEYAFQNVDPLIFRPKFLSENIGDFLHTNTPQGQLGIFPAQFFARPIKSIYSEKEKCLFRNNTVAQFKKNAETIMQKNFSRPRDVWQINCVQPYSSFTVCFSETLKSATTVLQQLEQEFILNFYENDPHLKAVDKKMEKLFGPDPLHYSNLKPQQIRVYDNSAAMLIMN